MSSKSEAYIKNLGSKLFGANFNQIEWDGRKIDAQNIGKESDLEFPTVKQHENLFWVCPVLDSDVELISGLIAERHNEMKIEMGMCLYENN